MSELHFYADAESIEVLLARTSKAILVGSDFGYGNFGDVLQHAGSISRIGSCSRLAVVSVLSLDAISRHVSVSALKRGYGAAALVFVSAAPISPDVQRQIGLVKVVAIHNVACVQLYGGGFLNEMWGEFVLGVAEFFLRRASSVLYVISGQQISENYAARVAKHVREFKPALVGVRDRDSLRHLRAHGVMAEFSFDDAVEPLFELSGKLPIHRGDGLFLHLNSSGYTGNESALTEIISHLRIIAENSSTGKAVLFQAFQDAREEVVDSLETIKRLEGALPFSSMDVVMLVSLIMGMQPVGKPVRPVSGSYGYACSYHITLWLQLNGIPCWLRGSNGYYDQKRRSLGVDGDFESFLERMPLVDHDENVAERRQWTARLESMFADVKSSSNHVLLPVDPDNTHFRSLSFKGEPRLSVRLDQSWAAVRGLQEEKHQLKLELERLGDEAVTHSELQSRVEDLVGERETLWGRLQESAQIIADLEMMSGELVSQRDSLQFQFRESEAKCSDLQVSLHGEMAAREAVQSNLDEVQIIMKGIMSRLQVVQEENGGIHHRLRETEASNESLLSKLLDATEQLADLRNTAKIGEELAISQRESMAAALAAVHQNEELLEVAQDQGRQLAGRVEALSEQVTYLGAECRMLSGKLREAEHGWYQACLGNEQLTASMAVMNAEKEDMQNSIHQLNEELLGTAQRLLACTEQLTLVGGEAREQRKQAESTYRLLEDVSVREANASRMLQQIQTSRSWRLTRPMRVLNRFAHTGRFDPAGDVGMFEACRRVGRRLPLPSSWVSKLGRLLRGLRRG